MSTLTLDTPRTLKRADTGQSADNQPQARDGLVSIFSRCYHERSLTAMALVIACNTVMLGLVGIVKLQKLFERR